MSDLSEFMDGLQRICKYYNICDHCIVNQWCELGFKEIATEYKQIENIVKQWTEEHPKKTRQDKFLKIYPHVTLIDGIINIDPCIIEKNYHLNVDDNIETCDECRKAYWMKEVEE